MWHVIEEKQKHCH